MIVRFIACQIKKTPKISTSGPFDRCHNTLTPHVATSLYLGMQYSLNLILQIQGIQKGIGYLLCTLRYVMSAV